MKIFTPYRVCPLGAHVDHQHGVIEGTLPIGGLSSSAAVILTYLNALCKANDIHLTPQGIIDMAIRIERNYIGVNVGKLDQSCEVYCKENCLLVLDTLDDSGRNIPFSKDMPPFEIMIMFSGVEAWKKGDLVTFGKMMFASGRSSIENYEAGSKQLTRLQDIIEHVDGIYGGRFSGAGFNGCSMALIDPAKREQIVEQVTREYLEAFPELTGRFSIHICNTANGVEL